MTINIQMKSIGKRARMIESHPYTFEKSPSSLRQVIEHIVSDSVSAYNRRLTDYACSVLSAEAVDAMANIGKIGFGLHFGSTPADARQAVSIAVSGYEDGLFRIFVNDREVTGLDAPLSLCENDTITIIRLVMLTGGFF